jgi:hypothetical protein
MSQIPKMLRPPRKPDLTCDPPKKGDLSFIYNSWLESYKESPDNPIKGEAYYDYHKMLIISILERSYISILCDPTDQDTIFGYAVYEFKDDSIVLHWIQVKYTFKRLGFATFIIDSIKDLAESKGIFNPIITITARGLAYKHLKDKIKHIYKPKMAFKLKEIQ